MLLTLPKMMDIQLFISGQWEVTVRPEPIQRCALCSEMGSYIPIIAALTARSTKLHHIFIYCITRYVSVCMYVSLYVSPAMLVDELLQPRFDLVVGEEGHVPRVSNCQAVPVPQQRRPRLHTHIHRNTRVTHLMCE